ncbi:MAG TPA: hypothetical protein ENI90_00035 [Methylothermaceae bacterium]|nr:hypothetical protein [Methylothermaceae bacterium]
MLFVYRGKFSKARLWRDFLIACIPTLLFFIAAASERWRGAVILIGLSLPFAWTCIGGWKDAVRRFRARSAKP